MIGAKFHVILCCISMWEFGSCDYKDAIKICIQSYFVLGDMDKNCSRLNLPENCNNLTNSHVSLRLIHHEATIDVHCYKDSPVEETNCSIVNKSNYFQDCLSSAANSSAWPSSVRIYSCFDGSLINTTCYNEVTIVAAVLPTAILIQILLIVILICWNRTGRRNRLKVLRKTKRIRISELPRKALQSYVLPKRKTLITFLRKSDPPPSLEFLKYTNNGSQQNSFREIASDESVPSNDVSSHEETVVVTVTQPASLAVPTTTQVRVTSCEDHDRSGDTIQQEGELTKPEIKIFPTALSDGSSIYSTIPLTRKLNLIHSANKHCKYIPTEVQEDRNSNVYFEINESPGITDNKSKSAKNDLPDQNHLPNQKGQKPAGTLPLCQSKSAFRKLNVQCWSNPCVSAPRIPMDCDNRRSNVSDSHIYSEIAWLDNVMLLSKDLKNGSTILEEIAICNSEGKAVAGSSEALLSYDRNVNGSQKSEYDLLGNNSATENHLYAPFRQLSGSSLSPNVSQDSHTYIEADVCIAEFARDQSDMDEMSLTCVHNESVGQLLPVPVDTHHDSKYDSAKAPGYEEILTSIEADDDTDEYWHPDGCNDYLSSVSECGEVMHTAVDANCSNLEISMSETHIVSEYASDDDGENYADLMDSLYVEGDDRDRNAPLLE